MAAITALTFAQLDTMTRNLLNDNINFEATAPESLTALTWDEEMLAEALNFAQKEYCRSTNVTYTEATVVVDANSFATTPTDRLVIERVKYVASGGGDPEIPPVFWTTGTIPYCTNSTPHVNYQLVDLDGVFTVLKQEGGLNLTYATYDYTLTPNPDIPEGEFIVLNSSTANPTSISYYINESGIEYAFDLSCVVTVEGNEYTLTKRVYMQSI